MYLLIKIKSSKRWHVFFDEHDNLKDHPKKTKPGSKSLSDALENPPDDEFVQFIKKCLEW
jgi:hypothetical protein